MMKEQLQKLREFYRERFAHWVFITAAAFLILIVLSLIIGLRNPDLASGIMTWFAQSVDDLGVIDEAGNFSAIELFFHNLRAMITGILCGLIPFLYLTALSLGVNSMLLGFFAAVYLNDGRPMVIYFASLFPHGIFELPAMIIAFSCGIYLCHTITDFVRNNEKNIVRDGVMDILRVFILNIVPLLIIAAVLEAYVTPLFASRFY